MVTAVSPALVSRPPSERGEVRELFGIPISAATMEQALDRVQGAIERRERLQIGVVNAAKVVNMRRRPAMSASLADWVINRAAMLSRAAQAWISSITSLLVLRTT